MAKKSFSNLNKGKEKLEDDLSSFLTTDQEENQSSGESSIFSFDNKNKKNPESEKKEPVIDSDKLKKDSDKKAEKSEPPKEQKTQEPKDNKPALKKTISMETSSESLPEDFRSHSVLVSEEQLGELQEKVLMHKLHVDKKFTMKMALYQALKLWLEQKEITPVEYPEDFITYSALISGEQYEKAQDKMLLYKAKSDRKYSMKRAVYEAIKMYLDR